MKVYLSNAMCGHQQYAYVIPFKRNSEESEDYKYGEYKCFVLSTNCDDYDEPIIDLDSIYLTETDKKIEDFSIYNDFLFKFFLETYPFEDFEI